MIPKLAFFSSSCQADTGQPCQRPPTRFFPSSESSGGRRAGLPLPKTRFCRCLFFASGGAPKAWDGGKYESGDICVQYQTTAMSGTCSTFSCGLAASCNAPRLCPASGVFACCRLLSYGGQICNSILGESDIFLQRRAASPIPEPKQNGLKDLPRRRSQRRRSRANPQVHKLRGGWERCGGRQRARTDSAAAVPWMRSRDVVGRPSSKTLHGHL